MFEGDLMRFYDGSPDTDCRPVSVPDWVADTVGSADWVALEEETRRDADADAVALASELPVVPDLLCPDLSDDEKTARGLATSETLPKDGRLRWWEIVAWSESCAPDWADRWTARPDVRGLACPHNLDVKNRETGELKKSHIHAMAGDAHGRKWSRAQALRFARDIFGLRPGKDDNLVRPIKSPSGYALYLTHANAPAKYQYPRESVLCFGGVDLDSVVGVVDNEKTILADIRHWVDDFYAARGVLPALATVVKFAEACRPAWARVLSTGRGSGSIKGYIRSLEYDMGLDGRGARTIFMVDELIEEDKETRKLSSD